MHRNPLALWLLAPCAALFVVLGLPGHRTAAGDAPPADLAPQDAADARAASAELPPPLPPPAVLGDMSYDERLGRYVAPLGEGSAMLTIVPELQQRLEKVLADHRVPWGATVLLEPRTGRVLAVAEYSAREPGARGLAYRALAPAASVFKIVTSAALLQRGYGPEQEFCYHGGRHRVSRRHLSDDPRRDHRCITLASALGRSANVVFARLADRGLSAELLRAEASRFLFNAPIPFERPVDVSRAEVSEDPYELATTAAGFGPVRLSPLHGALLAGIVANGGIFVPPRIVDEVQGGPSPESAGSRRVVDDKVAAALAHMMRATITEGTARAVFQRDRWSRGSALREVRVAGKTGSIADRTPYRDYSWFVGFAPVEDPRVAVATVIVNERTWRVKAPWVAHHALEAYFSGGWERHAALREPARLEGVRTASR